MWRSGRVRRRPGEGKKAVTDDRTTSAVTTIEHPADDDLEAIWSRSLAVIEETVTPQQRAFVRLSTLDGVVGDTALLSVPNEFAKDVIEQRLRSAEDDGDVLSRDREEVTEPRGTQVVDGDRRLAPVVAEHHARVQRTLLARQRVRAARQHRSRAVRGARGERALAPVVDRGDLQPCDDMARVEPRRIGPPWRDAPP